MSSIAAAIVLGASGSVGRALFEALVASGELRAVVTLVRRGQPEQLARAREAGVELREICLDAMAPASLASATTQAAQTLGGEIVGLSVLGVGAGTANLSTEEHRAVDVALNAAFAQGLAASGLVKHLAFMSVVGANPAAADDGWGGAGMPRYARVKGEAEQAVLGCGPQVVSIFRPALIIDSQHTPRLLGKVATFLRPLTPGKYRPLTVQQIATAMVATVLARPHRSKIYNVPQMMAGGDPSAADAGPTPSPG